MYILPRNYNLTFEPDLEKFTFKGEEIITFELKKKTKQIILDSVDLKIEKCQLYSSSEVEKYKDDSSRQARTISKISPFKIDQKAEKLIINFSDEIKPGEYKLFIEFEGVLNDKLAGFYRSKYTVDGKEKYLATTQFEAADARRAFPCIDSPSYKATFDVSLILNKDLTAVSNTLPKKTMDLDRYTNQLATEAVDSRARQRDKKGKKMVIFETTPLMSTYLLYLGVGEFEFLENKYKNILLRVVTTPGKSQYGEFALDCAKKFLEFYEKYFDYAYPLRKLDLIAVPDFASGAMENWGAITFRENALLLYPDLSSRATMQRISEVIAHEIVHQWFGNLVTMKWWDDLWLNESFATYMAYKAMDRYWPKWQVWNQYITDTVFEAMGLDSLRSSHSIKVEVKKVSEIDELFDEIAYEKGGSILRMLDLTLGEKIFRGGLRKYIKQFNFNNAEAKNLWSVLEKESKKSILDIMQSYLLQKGFPKISVRGKNNILFFEQHRFLYEGKDLKSVWKIPMVLKNGKNIIRQIFLNEKKLMLRFNPEEGLTTINHNYSGFYISQYSNDLLNELSKSFKYFTEGDKIGLIHDLFALILAGEKDLQELYRYIDTFFDDKSSIVLHYLISKLTGIFLLLQDENSKKLAINFSKKALKKVKYEPKKNENILDAYLRNTALAFLTLLNDKKVSQFVNKQFINYLKNEKSLHPDLRGVIYSCSVWINDSNHQIIRNFYRTSLVQEEKAKFLMALGNSKNKKLIQETLEYALSKEVPFAFLPYGVSSAARNPYAREITLDWLMMSWGELVKRSGGLGSMLLRRILQAVIPICGIGQEKKVEKFLNKNKIPGLERTVEQVLERLRINSRFVSKYKK